MKQGIRDYFIFTKKERIGVAILSLLVIVFFLLPSIIPVSKEKLNAEELAEIKEAYARLGKDIQPQENPNDRHLTTDRPFTREKDASEKPVLFYFDPNTASRENWLKLGLKAKTADQIIHYLAKGGKIRRPEDLKKIYSLRESDYARLLPFVRIGSAEKSPGAPGFSAPALHTDIRSRDYTGYDFKIDINAADTSEFKKLRGIGSRLAARLVLFRERLGGFYSIDQFGETFGISDSLFQQLKPQLLLGVAKPRKINLNEADAETLKQHPYIRWAMANNIVRYRSQHGRYSSVEELKQLHGIDSASLKRLFAYLTVSGD